MYRYESPFCFDWSLIMQYGGNILVQKAFVATFVNPKAYANDTLNESLTNRIESAIL